MLQRNWMSYLKNALSDKPSRTPTIFAMSFTGCGHQLGGGLGASDIITEDGEGLLFEDGTRVTAEDGT